MKTAVRTLTLISLVVTILSMMTGQDVCYTCNGITITALILLHVLLLASTFVKGQVMPFVALTLLIFYASRIAIIQFDPTFYTYPFFLPTSDEMSTVAVVLLAISAAMLGGCLIGEKLGRGYRGELHLMPFARGRSERGFYLFLLWLFIGSRVALLYLTVTSGVGLPISLSFFSPMLLRYAKIARMFSPFSILPVAWLILRKPVGWERRWTILAIVLSVLAVFSTLSKAAVIVSIVPFVLVYYVAGLRIPRRVVAIFGVLTISVVTVISTLMAQLRVAISLTYETPDTFNFASAGGWLGLKTNILGLLSRVGSSFDVLALVVLQRFQFLPYRNFSAELYDVVNGYVPGGLFAVDAPRWASALFGIGHDVNYESLLRIGTGENITLPGHLLVYFGVAGSCLVAFTVMLVFTLGYRYSSTVLVKTFLLTSIVFDVTNGSGLISMVLGYPTMMLALFLCYLAYRFLRGALVANTGARVPPSRRARLATIE